MLVKTMRSSAVVAILAAGLTACSESPTAPPSAGFDLSNPLMAKGGNGSGSSTNGGSGSQSAGRGKDAGSRTFTIWPTVPVFEKFGDHVLFIPANVVCDPATSGYGTAYWELPCQRAKQPIQVTATWTTHNGRPLISFSRDLRFAPSKSEQQWVKLWLRAPKEIGPTLNYSILWYDVEAKHWVDESLADPTLKARLEAGNLVTRRLKHFSDWALWVGLGSYNVTSGLGGGVDVWGGW
jgi:hypothetical protein